MRHPTRINPPAVPASGPRAPVFRLALALALGLATLASPSRATAAAPLAKLRPFLERHCVECHDAEVRKGGLDLTALAFEPAYATNYSRWVTLHDRVVAGEMPPKKKARPEPAELAAFTGAL